MNLDMLAQIADVIGIAFVIGTWVAVWRSYNQLPARVPTHFGFSGRPDQWGSRGTIWLLPIIAVVCFAALSASRYTGAPAPLNHFMALLKLEILAMLFSITRGQIRVALGTADRIGNAVWIWLAAVVLTGIIGAPGLPHR